MLIKNLKTGVTQECCNSDVVKVCRKHPDEYQILGNQGETEAGASDSEGDKADISKMKITDLRKLASEQGIDGSDSLNKAELLEVLKDVAVDDGY